MEQRFTWNAKKADSNLRKHGVAFEDAIEVFADPFYLLADDIADPGTNEQRYVAVGRTRDGRLLLATIFADRSEPGIETFHIISARKAIQYEKDRYEDQF